MKKTVLTLLILATFAFISNAQSGKLKVGDPVPKWVLPSAKKVDHSMDTWKGKVLQINYVDPDVSDINDPFNDKVNLAADIEKRINRDYFKGFGVIDSKSTRKPNGIIRMIAKKKEKKYGTTILFDYEAEIRNSWGLEKDAYTVVIVDKKRVCRAIYKGEIPEAKHEEIIQFIIKLTEE